MTGPVRVDRATFPSDVQTALAELEPVITRSPFLTALDGSVVGWGPGWAEVEIPTAGASANIAGTIHGGVVATAADCAFETACNSYGRMCVAVSLSCQFTLAAEVGSTLRAVAYEVSRSRGLSSYRIDVTARPGGPVAPTGPGPEPATLVAWFQALAHRSREWHLGAARWPDEWRERY